jgi:hypothetical protein
MVQDVIGTLFVIGAVFGVLALFMLRTRPAPAWQIGGVYSIRADDAGFGLAKVLAIERHVVCVRVYAQRFQRRPTSIVVGEARAYDVAGAPVPEERFAGWAPVLVTVEALDPEEHEASVARA